MDAAFDTHCLNSEMNVKIVDRALMFFGGCISSSVSSGRRPYKAFNVLKVPKVRRTASTGG